MLRQRALSLLILVALTSACGSYDPARDRKIPRPPKVVEWTYSVHIDAPPEQVWAVLVDFDQYQSWNPWLIAASGPAEVGARVDISVLLDDKQRDMWHRVVEVEAPHRFCWRDAGPTTNFATGLRCRDLVPDGAGGTEFTVVLTVGGSFRKTVNERYGELLDASMKAETDALRAEVMRRGANSQSSAAP